MNKINDIWTWLIIVGIAVIAFWAILKAFGLINTPVWVEMIPYWAGSGVLAGFLVKLGRILQKVDTVCRDVDNMKGKLDELRVHCPKCK